MRASRRDAPRVRSTWWPARKRTSSQVTENFPDGITDKCMSKDPAIISPNYNGPNPNNGTLITPDANTPTYYFDRVGLDSAAVDEIQQYATPPCAVTTSQVMSIDIAGGSGTYPYQPDPIVIGEITNSTLTVQRGPTSKTIEWLAPEVAAIRATTATISTLLLQIPPK